MPKIKATLLSLVAIFALSSSGLAQTPTPPPNTGKTSATTANPELQKQLAPSQRAQKKQRRASCEKQFSQQKKLSRFRFMRNCLKA